MKMRGQSGFTIVELIVVIIVIGVLATITSMMYNSSQQQAADARIRDAADKFADAIQVWSAQNGGMKPMGGAGSTTPVSSTVGCVDGAQGYEDYNQGSADPQYKCTIGDAMVAMGYLPADLFNSLPANSLYHVTKYIFQIYPCANNTNQWLLMYNLQAPNADDTTNLNNTLTACGSNPATWPPVTTWGARGVVKIKFA